MKTLLKLFNFILCFVLLHSDSFSQNGWFWQNPLPQGSTLNCIRFVNSQTGFAVGNVGAIVKSVDGGESWSLYNNNFLNDIYSVSFADADIVFAVGADGFMIKTTNSGITWSRISLGTTDTLQSVYFYDSNSGYICGSNGKVFKTIDSGNNWIEQISGTNVKLNSICFVNSNKGYICGTEKLLRTTNGGDNWTVSNIYGNNKSISFINDNTGFTAVEINNGLGYVHKTTNGGNTWIIKPLSNKISLDVQFINSTTGFLTGTNNTFYKTTNTGTSWSIDETITADGFSLNSVFFSNSGEGYLAGTQGTIFKSTDTGNNWSAKAPAGTLETFALVDFTSQNTGYIAGNSFYKTTNGGDNWISLNTSFPAVFRIQFLNNYTGYVFSFPNLYKTSDGGNSWFRINSQSDTLTATFINANTGFCTKEPYGFPEDLYKTTNGGINWIVHSFSPKHVYFYQFPAADLGYLVLTDFTTSDLYKTTNLGDNWSYISNVDFDTTTFRWGFFVNQNLGFLLRYSYSSDIYKLFKTTNGGINWNFNSYLKDFTGHNTIKFINNTTGFIIQEHGLLKTTNEGDNWTDYVFADIPILDIEATDDNTLYAVSYGGFIKKTTNGGTVDIDNVTSFVPLGFTLKQNYPNPFNPKTIISYELPIANNIKLIIYDILGKQVSVLINEKQNAGTYEIEFNGENLSSGIYFYKIEAGEFVETKRMVLLK